MPYQSAIESFKNQPILAKVALTHMSTYIRIALSFGKDGDTWQQKNLAVMR